MQIVFNGRYGDALAAARRDIEVVAGERIKAVAGGTTPPAGRDVWARRRYASPRFANAALQGAVPGIEILLGP